MHTHFGVLFSFVLGRGNGLYRKDNTKTSIIKGGVILEKEKMRLILNAMQGITYLEWQKLRHCIDVRFSADANAAANKMPLADADQIIETYHSKF